jgi:cytochrome c oxidase assembly protein subunit 11
VSAERGPDGKGVQPAGSARANLRYAIGALSIAIGMLGLTYAAVPFYTLFCRATGYEGTPQRVARDHDREGHRLLRVAFDANVAPGLPWRFEPETEAIHVRAGKAATVFFRAENVSDSEVAASAVFNVTPEVSGGYFDKVQCFCFNVQHLGPHETAEWPVVFFLDPKLEQDPSMAQVESITLSYTLYAAPAAQSSAGSSRRAGPAG